MKMKLGKVVLLALSNTAILIRGLAIGTSLPQSHGVAIDTDESRVAAPDHNGDSLNYDRSFEVRATTAVFVPHSSFNSLHRGKPLTCF